MNTNPKACKLSKGRFAQVFTAFKIQKCLFFKGFHHFHPNFYPLAKEKTVKKLLDKSGLLRYFFAWIEALQDPFFYPRLGRGTTEKIYVSQRIQAPLFEGFFFPSPRARIG